MAKSKQSGLACPRSTRISSREINWKLEKSIFLLFQESNWGSPWLSVLHCDLNYSATLSCYLLFKSCLLNLIWHRLVSHWEAICNNSFGGVFEYLEFFSQNFQTHFEIQVICTKLFEGCLSICAYFQVLKLNINRVIDLSIFIYIYVIYVTYQL